MDTNTDSTGAENSSSADSSTSSVDTTETTQQTDTSSQDVSTDFDWAARLDSTLEQALDPSNKTEETKTGDTKATEDKTEEVKTEDTKAPTESDKDEVPKNLTEKAQVKWKELKAEAAEAEKLKSVLAEKDAEIERLKSEQKPADTSEIESTKKALEDLRKVNEEYEKELSVARVEATQEFKNSIVRPMANIMNYASDLAKRYEIKDSDILSALAEEDSALQNEKLTEVASLMSERDRLRLYALADDHAAVMAKREEFRESAREKLNSIQKASEEASAKLKLELEQHEKATKAEYQTATEKVLGDLVKSIPVLKNEDVLNDVKSIAASDMAKSPAEIRAYLTQAGAILPHLLRAYNELNAKLQDSEKTILSYRGNSAPAGGGKATDPSALDPGIGFLEAIEAGIR